MRNVKFSERYRIEMPSNYANSLRLSLSPVQFLIFFAYLIIGIRVTWYKNNKTCYKTLQRITYCLLQQKP